MKTIPLPHEAKAFDEATILRQRNERLLQALDHLLEQTVDMDLKYGIALSDGEEEARDNAIAAIAESKGLLPPDPENRNNERAAWAGVALQAFRAETGADIEDALGDLLADLRHWCDRHNQDFQGALDRSQAHYEAETLGEE